MLKEGIDSKNENGENVQQIQVIIFQDMKMQSKSEQKLPFLIILSLLLTSYR